MLLDYAIPGSDVTVLAGRPDAPVRECPLERFIVKVEFTESGCWLWRGAISGTTGYAQFHDKAGRRVGGHRWIYTALVGPIPQGYVIDHTCRVPACVNPDHLEPVTHRTNCLRGESPYVVAFLKNECPVGHLMIAPYIRPDTGKRRCRTCRDAYMVAYRQARRDSRRVLPR